MLCCWILRVLSLPALRGRQELQNVRRGSRKTDTHSALRDLVCSLAAAKSSKVGQEHAGLAVHVRHMSRHGGRCVNHNRRVSVYLLDKTLDGCRSRACKISLQCRHVCGTWVVRNAEHIR